MFSDYWVHGLQFLTRIVTEAKHFWWQKQDENDVQKPEYFGVAAPSIHKQTWSSVSYSVPTTTISDPDSDSDLFI